MISLQNITKRYVLGKEVWEMKNINLEIEKNSFVVITGISGSGKSTFLHLVGGLDFPNEGEILIDGQKLNALDDKNLSLYRNKKVGFVFQNFYLYPDINLVENVALPLLIAGVEKTKREKLAKKALELVGLKGLENHTANQVSGGQSQRVAIARAMINRPKILLADEPTGNLDSRTGRKILDLLQSLRQKQSMILIIVTHDEYIAKQADRIIEIQDGKIISDVLNHKSKSKK